MSTATFSPIVPEMKMKGISARDSRAIASALGPLNCGMEKSEMTRWGWNSSSSRRKSDSVCTRRLWKSRPPRFSSRCTSSASVSLSSATSILRGSAMCSSTTRPARIVKATGLYGGTSTHRVRKTLARQFVKRADNPLVREPLRPLRRDDPGVDPAPVEPAEEPPVLDLHAAIHDRLESRGLGLPRRLGVRHAQLLPQHFRADGDRVLGDRHDLRGLSEAVDDVDLHRDVAQRLVAFLAEDGVVSRVDRDHGVAVLEHVFRRKVAGTEPVAREADDGDHLARLEDAAQPGDVVDHGRDSIES